MSTDPTLGVPDVDFDDDDVEEVKDSVVEGKVDEIHIRIQQRNGRKCLTIVQGLPQKLKMKKILSYFKKQCCCNGTIVEDPKAGKVLQLTGDQRQSVAEFLVCEKIARKEQIKVHGI